ncbi:MAG: hypothetical protein EXX96DRAFT_613873 [Benjaminiella poitrasii]|nr:MAG: hypothetical protein EXX96DRAFT_613873 [Benjaminiella poitrasii]
MPVLQETTAFELPSSIDRPSFLRDIREDVSSQTTIVRHSAGYRFVKNTDRKYRKPPARFSVKILSIDGDVNKKTCHPGSIFEGIVEIKADMPLAVQYLKLVFKAAERIHIDSSFGSKLPNTKKGERLFAVRTVLWGSPSDTGDEWPLIEIGKHQFPFMCEMPMVNYPPSFRHHLASCEFELVASLERPGIRPFQTTPCPIRYEPLVITRPVCEPSCAYRENIRITNTHKVLLTLNDGCYYSLLDPESTLKLQLSIIDRTLNEKNNNNSSNLHKSHTVNHHTRKNNNPLYHSNRMSPSSSDDDSSNSISSSNNISSTLLSHIEAFIKREVDVTHGSYRRSDTMVMTHIDQSNFSVGQMAGHHTYYVNLPLPTILRKDNNSIILKNFSVLGMTTTIDFSKHVKMEYKLYITAKVRHGLLSTRRQLFCVPIRFGTIAPGEPSPSSIVGYRDPFVITDTTLTTKPKFIRPPQIEEQLPAYDEESSPPLYGSSD